MEVLSATLTFDLPAFATVTAGRAHSASAMHAGAIFCNNFFIFYPFIPAFLSHIVQPVLASFTLFLNAVQRAAALCGLFVVVS